MRKFLPILGIAVMMISCEKELDFHYKDVEPQLVIEGRTTQAGTFAKLSLTTPMDEPLNRIPLTDAEVSVIDLDENAERTLSAGEDGIFYDPVPGIPGHTYRLEVLRQGVGYLAESAMQPQAEILNLEFQWIKMPYDYVAVIQVSFLDLPGNGDNYWIRMYKNSEPYMWLLSDDLGSSSGGVINVVAMTSRMDLDEEDERSSLRDGDVMEVVVSPVSRQMYDYLTAIQSDSNGPKMFAGGYCLGYYVAASESRLSVVFHSDEMKYFNDSGSK